MNADGLRAVVLREAEAEAEALLADAEAAAADEVARAREEAEAALRRGRAAGEHAAELERIRAEALARRQARTTVLAARRKSYETLRRESLVAALGIREGGRYPALLERLSAAARAQLGAQSVLEVDPPEVGGVRARAGNRSVDYTLPKLVDRCVEALGGRVQELWR